MYFDIGANVGKWSLDNILNEDCKKIIAIEASPTTFDKLVVNINNNPNIICLNYAVCNSKEEWVTFYHCDSDTLSTLNSEWILSPTSRFYNYNKITSIKCKPITIDTLIETYGIPELIKIDVECGEYECISSLSKKINNICFEWASETNNITMKCIHYLYDLGYTYFSLQFEDNYLYRADFYVLKEDVIQALMNTTPKNEWGMVWAK